MSWKKLQAEGKVRAHKTSRKELDDWRASFAISRMPQFRSCLTIAASQSPTMLLCKQQPCPSPVRDFGSPPPGHHHLTFEVARLALGAPAHTSLDFFEACRRKRNVIDYDHASVATHTEAEEIVAEAKDFFELVDRRIVANHPRLAR